MNLIVIRDAYGKGKLLGWMGLSWEVVDAVRIESSICRFDFNDHRVKLLSDFSDKEGLVIGQIRSISKPSLKPFIGSVIGDNYSLRVVKKLLGIEMEFQISGFETIKVDVGLTASFEVGQVLNVRFERFERSVVVEVDPEFKNMGIVVGAIILKYGLKYLIVDSR